MKLSQIFKSAAEVGAFLLGGREYRTVVLSSGDERFVLPVTPWRYQMQTAQDNKTVDILDTGEALIFGNARLKRLKFSCFFPAVRHEYPFVVGDEIETEECIALILKWKENKSPVRVIITDSPVNLQMAIMDFDYEERDGTRDIYYTLNFTEYRNLNTPRANNDKAVDDLTGLRERPNADRTVAQVSAFVSKVQDVLEASKQAYGNFQSVQNFLAVNNVSNLGTRKISSVIKSGGWKF